MTDKQISPGFVTALKSFETFLHHHQVDAKVFYCITFRGPTVSVQARLTAKLLAKFTKYVFKPDLNGNISVQIDNLELTLTS